MPTFQAVIDLPAQEPEGARHRIYPETKHPSYFRSIGLMLEAPLVKTLVANGYTDTDAPVFIQSFEVQNLKDLSKLTRIRLVQLMEADKRRPYDFVLTGTDALTATS